MGTLLPDAGSDLPRRGTSPSHDFGAFARRVSPPAPGVIFALPAVMTFSLDRLTALLGVEAPYLTNKLLRLKIVRTPDEATDLFQEVKKYLVLCDVHRSRPIPMFSRRVDEVWHQLVLFTAQYDELTRTFFGKFVHHDPAEAGSNDALQIPQMSFVEFRAAYEALFGELPDAWFDDRSIHTGSRVARASWGRPLALRRERSKIEIVLESETPVVLCRVDAWAAPALERALSWDAFYVRELPGLESEDQVVLSKALVKVGVLYVAP